MGGDHDSDDPIFRRSNNRVWKRPIFSSLDCKFDKQSQYEAHDSVFAQYPNRQSGFPVGTMTC